MSSLSYSAREVARVTRGTLAHSGTGAPLTSISTDTRQIEKNAIFVALQGEHHDGHDFVDHAIDAGAGCVVVHPRVSESKDFSSEGRCAVVEVEDTLDALGELAGDRLRRWGGRTIGLTGSAGKTTTKDLIAAALAPAGRVLSTPGNWNNQIGLPLTVFRLDDEDFTVLEMGTNEPGEIEKLARIANPDVGLITNIGPAHLSGFGTVDDVQLEKGALFRQLTPSDTAIVNQDDPRIVALAEQCSAKQISYGTGTDSDVCVVDVRMPVVGLLEIRLQVDGRPYDVSVEGLGPYMGGNVAAAVATAVAVGVEPEVALSGISKFKAPSHRMVHREFGDIHVIDDCYNANPKSGEVALATLAAIANEGRRAVVLGDMLELGSAAVALHEELGRKAGDSGLACVFAVGAFAQSIVEGVRAVNDTVEVHTLENAQAAASAVIQWVQPGDWVLVKGSRGLALESVVEAFERLEV